jgi:putative membrane protein
VDKSADEYLIHRFWPYLIHHHLFFLSILFNEAETQDGDKIMDWLAPYYTWVKALHVMAVIAWMAGLFYLPRLFVYHAEKAKPGSELDLTFLVMEAKLLRLIMNPAMITAWICGLLMIGMGGLDFSTVWSWAKLGAVVAMTVAHMWMAARRKDFAEGRNTRSGRTYRMANEVPTVLMVVAVIAVIVRPF